MIEKFKVKLIFFTNATSIPKGKELNRIMANLHRLIVSFDAAGKKIYEKIRRFARYEKVIDNIRRFNNVRNKIEKDKRPLLTLKLVLMRSNIEELSDWVKLAKDLEVDSIVVSHVVIFDKELEQESLIYHKGLANYHIEKAGNLADELSLSVEEFPPLYSESSNTEQEFELDKSEPCGFLWREAFIELDGSVYPCCGSVKRGLLMGNVKRQTFDEIWNGPEYQALRRGFKTGDVLPHCKSCYLRIRHTNPDKKEIFIL